MKLDAVPRPSKKEAGRRSWAPQDLWEDARLKISSRTAFHDQRDPAKNSPPSTPPASHQSPQWQCGSPRCPRVRRQSGDDPERRRSMAPPFQLKEGNPAPEKSWNMVVCFVTKRDCQTNTSAVGQTPRRCWQVAWIKSISVSGWFNLSLKQSSSLIHKRVGIDNKQSQVYIVYRVSCSSHSVLQRRGAKSNYMFLTVSQVADHPAGLVTARARSPCLHHY